MQPCSLTTIGNLLWLANPMPILISDNFRIVNFDTSQLEFGFLLTIFLTQPLLSDHGSVFRGFDPLMV